MITAEQHHNYIISDMPLYDDRFPAEDIGSISTITEDTFYLSKFHLSSPLIIAEREGRNMLAVNAPLNFDGINQSQSYLLSNIKSFCIDNNIGNIQMIMNLQRPKSERLSTIEFYEDKLEVLRITPQYIIPSANSSHVNYIITSNAISAHEMTYDVYGTISRNIDILVGMEG